jgi:LTXXQ motif family protein
LRAQQRQQLQDVRAAQRQQRLKGQQPQQATRRDGTQQVTGQQARQGRFAAQIQNRQANWAGRRGWDARHAWRRGQRAVFVPWFGAVFWPYAYSDVFDYTFWPYNYDPAYWAYAYDDFFDGIFFPDGAPYVDYVYEGPYQGGYARRDRDARETTGSVSSGGDATPGRVSQAARELCAEPAKGVTAWPFERIEQAVAPNAEQRALLEDLKNAAAQAAERFKQSCPENLPMTPPGRLQAMTMRLQATLDAVKLVRPPLEKFYNSLSDEQKARFNAIGPDLGKDQQRAARSETQNQQADCGGEKAGLTALPIERIEEVVQPSVAQAGALDRLSEAMDKAVQVLQSACPTTIAQTPVGRLEVMQKRLEAMIEAANTVRPALEDFYASLNNEQKAKFNRLGRDSARRG